MLPRAAAARAEPAQGVVGPPELRHGGVEQHRLHRRDAGRVLPLETADVGRVVGPVVEVDGDLGDAVPALDQRPAQREARRHVGSLPEVRVAEDLPDLLLPRTEQLGEERLARVDVGEVRLEADPSDLRVVRGVVPERVPGGDPGLE
jgi:hypothetical protein